MVMSLIPDPVSGMDIHSAYFDTQATVALMANVLLGLDRGVLDAVGKTQGHGWPAQSSAGPDA